MVLLFLFHLPECICVIDLENERAAVPAVFAEIHLSDVSAGNGKNFLALAFRAVKHGKQLYMGIRYKN